MLLEYPTKNRGVMHQAKKLYLVSIESALKCIVLNIALPKPDQLLSVLVSAHN